MISKQNIIEYVIDQKQQGKLTADQANVLMVQMEGVRVVRGKVPIEVRKALNESVKTGELGHMKKDGLKPEVYHHKNARPKAIEIRNREERLARESINKMFLLQKGELL